MGSWLRGGAYLSVGWGPEGLAPPAAGEAGAPPPLYSAQPTAVKEGEVWGLRAQGGEEAGRGPGAGRGPPGLCPAARLESQNRGGPI